jgi:hypothetical protein
MVSMSAYPAGNEWRDSVTGESGWQPFRSIDQYRAKRLGFDEELALSTDGTVSEGAGETTMIRLTADHHAAGSISNSHRTRDAVIKLAVNWSDR